jgi:predicted ATP-dependent endonuclease of OLD family
VHLDTVYARFFRSLNFDYLRLSSPSYVSDPWDKTPTGEDFPFVKIRLERDITTVVGGNESGKSQVLAAIEAALTGDGFDRSDFCRYSEYFTVDKLLTKPEFGALFRDITPDDKKIIGKICELDEIDDVDRVALFRMNDTPQLRMYVRVSGEWQKPKHVKAPTLLRQVGVPAPFKIDAGTPLPDSVPLEYLATGKARPAVGRKMLRDVWDTLASNSTWFASSDTVSSKAAEIAEAFRGTHDLDETELKKYQLASDLLLKVAGLGRDIFVELQDAVRSKNGYANSIVDTINSELAKALNFPHWWSQDSHFELFVSLYEYDLVFMIRDRTGRSYGFDERSDGLKYFLSYFVQYLSHETADDGQPEILLMDEPDKFLSASGQQDLLRIFADFADPEDSNRRPVQVVYVTHSPFLIDKNHSQRIRVLEKGEHDEGTRVVSSAAQNHYEPLRSAFGSFVGETAFIGTCNLMLEGQSDQIILAGVSSWLGRRGVPSFERIDLNAVTLVPAGGVSQVPYLVYLARGRDVEQPAVIVLLDGDKAGDEARSTIRKGGARRKALVDDSLVLQLNDQVLDSIEVDNPLGRLTIEDLIPAELAIEAAASYCEEFVPEINSKSINVDVHTLYRQGSEGAQTSSVQNKGTIDALERAIRTSTTVGEFHLDKIGFARSLLRIIDASQNQPALSRLESNFRILLSELGRRQRSAVRAENSERVSSRIKRSRDRFIRNHSKVRREHVLMLIEEISGQLDNSIEAEDVRAEMRTWHVTFQLDEDPRAEISDVPALHAQLQSLAYLGVRNSATE